MELNFELVNGTYEAKTEVGGDFKIQVVFDVGLSGKISISRSLDNENFCKLGQSVISNCPVIQTSGLSDGEYIKISTPFEPKKIIVVEL